MYLFELVLLYFGIYIQECNCPFIYACMLSRCSHAWLFATLWTVAHQLPLSMSYGSSILNFLRNFHNIFHHSCTNLPQWTSVHFSPYPSLQLLFMSFMMIAIPGGSDGKWSFCNVGDLGSIPGSGRSTGEGNGTPLQYFCLKNSMDRGDWWTTVYGIAKSRIQLSN